MNYGKILAGTYQVKLLKPNRPSTLLILEVETADGPEIKEYVVGWTDNWRPTEDLKSLEVVIRGDFAKTQFTRLVWWWKEYCGFDWGEYTRTGPKGGVYPTYPISELIGREL